MEWQVPLGYPTSGVAAFAVNYTNCEAAGLRSSRIPLPAQDHTKREAQAREAIIAMSEQRSVNTDVSDQEDFAPFTRPPWTVVTLFGVIAAVVAAGIVWWNFEPQYEASNLFQIKSRTPFLAYRDIFGQAGYDRFVQMQMGLILDPMVLASVAKDVPDVPELEEAEDPVKWLTDNITVNSVGNSELYSISLTTSDKKDCAEIVNAVFTAYYSLLGQEGIRASQDIIHMLREERDDREEQVKRLQDRVRELCKQAGLADPFVAGPTNPVLEYPIAELHDRLVTEEVEQDVLSARIKVLEKELSEGLVEAPAVLIEEAVDQDPQVLQLLARIGSNELKLREMESKSDSPEEADGFKELQKVLLEDEQLHNEVRGDVEKQVKARAEESRTLRLQGALEAMRTDLEARQFMKKLLRERYEEKLDEAEVAGGDTVELGFATRELAEAETVFNALSERILQLTTEQDAPDRVKFWRPAVPAISPVEAVPSKRMILAASVFCLPFLIVGLCRLFVRSRVLDDPVFGGIRFNKPRLWRGEVSFHDQGAVGVTISARRAGPTDADRQVFLELGRRYPDLKPSIANLLFGQYERYQGAVAETYGKPGVPTLSQPEEIWDHACLEGFRIDNGRNSSIPSLRLAYTFEWDKVRMFFVHVWDWEVVRVEEDHEWASSY